MPELPEVETIVRDLDRLATGAAMDRVEVFRPDLLEGNTPEEFASRLRDRTIGGVGRRAKNIVFDLGADRLVVNLGMTGRLLVLPGDAPLPPHTGVCFTLRDGRLLAYHDVRRFGRLQVYSEAEWTARQGQMGLEPLDPGFTPEALREMAARSRVAIKSWLMDQRRVVGVGNIYASEALFRAGIDPRRPAHTLSARDAARLHEATRAVLQEAIDFRGTTLLDYRDASGERGGFAARLRVYDRAGEPCRGCGEQIVRIVQGGRSTFFCERCQS